VELLAYVDQSHGNLSGPATKHILQREYAEYVQAAFQRIAQVSVAQIYRFRNSPRLTANTTPAISRHGPHRFPSASGANRAPKDVPAICASPRCIKATKGLYHIHAVDEVTQWEIVAAVPQISERWLIPVLQQILEQFPFVIWGFYSDNGSEFINYTVAQLLEKLVIEQTKSRAHRSGDNGLVETKNGAVVRKHMGFGHIPAAEDEAVDQFHRQYLNPYVNFHRPSAIPEVILQPNGKRRPVYRRWATPLEILIQTPQCESYLRAGISLDELRSQAQKQSDRERRSKCSGPRRNCWRQSPGGAPSAHFSRCSLQY
jgi:hypothetical protein